MPKNMPAPPQIETHADYQLVPLAEFVAQVRRRLGRGGAPKNAIDADHPVTARINHGKWLADCPFCAGAELVDLSDPRFFCLSCDMAANGHRWVRVELPQPPRRAQIEAVLLARARHQNQNWYPHESVDDLRRENADHGERVP